ncbi:helix-turn-helix domain-containing protein, partial [Halarchaeum acidiphilum]
AIGARTRDVRIEYEREDGIGPAFTARGFLLDGRSHMTEDGERWPFHVHTDRDRLEATLETIQREHEVDITLGSITTNDGRGALTMDERHAELAPRQRDAFALARKRGYYNWPRDVTAATLADELGVAEPTFLEYLRTAESTLLDPGR